MVSNPGMNPILNPHAVVRVSRRMREPQAPIATVPATAPDAAVGSTDAEPSEIGVWRFWAVSAAALLAPIPLIAALVMILGH
ncbi:MAG: hypothetical protein ACFCUJ_12195 [Thiotrichales bacterium]